MRLLSFICALIAVFSISSCALVHTERTDTAGLLPHENDVPGWRLHAPPGSLRGSAAALYLKERAPLLQSYSLREIVFAEYEQLEDAKNRIAIEIYRMKSPLDAFGIFSRTRGFSDIKTTVGSFTDAYCAGVSCYLCRDRYYIRLAVSNQNEEILTTLSPFIGTLDAAINTAGDPLPEYAYCFGKRGERENLIYVARNAPEYPLRAGFFIRKRSLASSVKTLIYTRRGSQEEAMNEYSSLVCGEDSCAVLRSGEYQSAVRGPGERGYALIALYRDWLFGVLDASTIGEGEEAIKTLFGELIAYKSMKK